MAVRKLRKSDIVRLVQFASWADDQESMTLEEATSSVDGFLESHGAKTLVTQEELDAAELGLD